MLTIRIVLRHADVMTFFDVGKSIDGRGHVREFESVRARARIRSTTHRGCQHVHGLGSEELGELLLGRHLGQAALHVLHKRRVLAKALPAAGVGGRRDPPRGASPIP